MRGLGNSGIGDGGSGVGAAGETGSARLRRNVVLPEADPAARGADAFTFRAFGNGAASTVATVTLEYGAYVPCEKIDKHKTKCRNHKVKAVVIFSTYDNEAVTLAFAVDGAQHTAVVMNRKAKLILSNPPSGGDVVERLDPPN